MTQRQQLLKQIASLEAHVETQLEKYDIATKSLSKTQAKIAVSEIASKVGRQPLAQKDVQEFDNALTNSAQGVTGALFSLGVMRKELDELKSTLAMLPE